MKWQNTSLSWLWRVCKLFSEETGADVTKESHTNIAVLTTRKKFGLVLIKGNMLWERTTDGLAWVNFQVMKEDKCRIFFAISIVGVISHECTVLFMLRSGPVTRTLMDPMTIRQTPEQVLGSAEVWIATDTGERGPMTIAVAVFSPSETVASRQREGERSSIRKGSIVENDTVF